MVACDNYLELMDSLRVAMNRGLFLGLEDFSHFAMYPPGAFYLNMWTVFAMTTGAWCRQ